MSAIKSGTFRHQVILRKEALKFSAAHMTVFPDGTKESLHGHNYQVELSLELKSIALSDLISFSVFKQTLRQFCEAWDEKVLLPERCPYFVNHSLETQASDPSIEFQLCGKRYVLPREEVELLPLETITSETLSHELCQRLCEAWAPWITSGQLRSVQVRVDESLGQGGVTCWSASP